MKTPIIKRRGHPEDYDERKLYASIYAAALNAHYGELEAEKFADAVTARINKWIKGKKEISSHELRLQVIMQMHDPEVALLYKHHLDVC